MESLPATGRLNSSSPLLSGNGSMPVYNSSSLKLNTNRRAYTNSNLKEDSFRKSVLIDNHAPVQSLSNRTITDVKGDIDSKNATQKIPQEDAERLLIKDVWGEQQLNTEAEFYYQQKRRGSASKGKRTNKSYGSGHSSRPNHRHKRHRPASEKKTEFKEEVPAYDISDDMPLPFTPISGAVPNNISSAIGLHLINQGNASLGYLQNEMRIDGHVNPGKGFLNRLWQNHLKAEKEEKLKKIFPHGFPQGRAKSHGSSSAQPTTSVPNSSVTTETPEHQKVNNPSSSEQNNQFDDGEASVEDVDIDTVISPSVKPTVKTSKIIQNIEAKTTSVPKESKSKIADDNKQHSQKQSNPQPSSTSQHKGSRALVNEHKCTPKNIAPASISGAALGAGIGAGFGLAASLCFETNTGHHVRKMGMKIGALIGSGLGIGLGTSIRSHQLECKPTTIESDKTTQSNTDLEAQHRPNTQKHSKPEQPKHSQQSEAGKQQQNNPPPLAASHDNESSALAYKNKCTVEDIAPAGISGAALGAGVGAGLGLAASLCFETNTGHHVRKTGMKIGALIGSGVGIGLGTSIRSHQLECKQRVTELDQTTQKNTDFEDQHQPNTQEHNKPVQPEHSQQPEVSIQAEVSNQPLIDSSHKFDCDLDFYAYGVDGSPRTLRNDLVGDLTAEIQFIQSHSAAPSNNYYKNATNELNSRYMPDIVAEREALLVAIPQVELSDLEIQAEVNGTVTFIAKMDPPSRLPKSDYNDAQNRPTVCYSKHAWSIKLPWEQVVPGMSYKFKGLSGGKEISGELLKENIDISPFSQLIIQPIRIGVFAEPPRNDDQIMTNNPQLAAAEYFQTIPVSKLVLGQYEDIRLDFVMMSNGDIINGTSSDTGGVYSGDLLSQVAKGQICSGINQANSGKFVSSLALDSFSSHHKQIVALHMVGQYKNGLVHHGLMAEWVGADMIQVVRSAYNEISHELGHALGLRDYSGAHLTQDQKWSVHHADSGWGWLANNNMLRTNIDWDRDNLGAFLRGGLSPYNFQGIYSYRRSAMSGNSYRSFDNHYSSITGHDLRIIQQHLKNRAIPDMNFTSGFKKWNSGVSQFVDAPANLKPYAIGVPVTMIVGAYNTTGHPKAYYLDLDEADYQFDYDDSYLASLIDVGGEVNSNQTYINQTYTEQTHTNQTSTVPIDANVTQAKIIATAVEIPGKILSAIDHTPGWWDFPHGIIYPLVRGNYGNLFDYPKPPASGEFCLLNITNNNYQEILVGLPPIKIDSKTVNKFHVNVPSSFMPTRVELECQINNVWIPYVVKEFTPSPTEMNKPAIVGQGNGYTELKQQQLPLLDTELCSLYGLDSPELSPQLEFKLNTFTKDELRLFSLKAQDVINRVNAQKALRQSIDGLIKKAKVLLNNYNAEQAINLRNQFSNSYNITFDSLTVNSTKTSSGLSSWVIDSRNAIHSANSVDLCLTLNGKRIQLIDCNLQNNWQSWPVVNDSIYIKEQDRCLSFNSVRNTFSLSHCHHQDLVNKTRMLNNDNWLLSKLSGDEIRALHSLMGPKRILLDILDRCDVKSPWLKSNNISISVKEFGDTDHKSHSFSFNVSGEAIKILNKCLNVAEGSDFTMFTDCGNNDMRWFFDTKGLIHNARQPYQCLVNQGTKIALSLCDPHSSSQIWLQNRLGEIVNRMDGNCMDYASNLTPNSISWSCHGDQNQNASHVPLSENRVFEFLNGEDIQQLYSLHKKL